MRKRALISVSNKTGIVDLAKSIVGLGWEIIASRGTAKVLTDAGIPVILIEEVTGNPECLDGRVKTISFHIAVAILCDRRNPISGIQPIDMVVCNFYPFEEVTAQEGCSIEEAVESIDIGGVTIVRAAAKNYKDVIVISDPADYKGTISSLGSKGGISEEMRLLLAHRTFEITAQYDQNIAKFLERIS